MNKNTWTYGADIEVFIKQKGEITAASIVLPNRHCTGIDNICLEYHTYPQETLRAYTKEIRARIAGVAEHVYAYKGEVITIPSMCLKDNKNYGSQVNRFGCHADYNAYNTKHQRRLKAIDYKQMRTAGGHGHIGFPADGWEQVIQRHNITKVLDVYTIGIQGGDDRSLLFPPGTFRPTSYGIEYRVLDNRWVNGYSVEFRELINALYKLKKYWEIIKTLDTELEVCKSVQEVNNLLLKELAWL